MGQRGNDGKRDSTAKRKLLAGGVLLAGLLLLVGWYIWKTGRTVAPVVAPREVDTVAAVKAPVTAKAAAVPAAADTVADTAPRAESPEAAPVTTKHIFHPVKPPDTAGKEPPPQPSAEDTAKAESDSLFSAAPPDDCSGDTVALWVFPDPSGGLYRGPLTIGFHVNKPCSVAWRFASDSAWRAWSEEPIPIERTSTIEYKAVDRCGRVMDKRDELYEIARAETTDACPEGMAFVKVGATQFCIDRYEWPNRKGAVPVSYVSLYQAMDSCLSAGKRLCSSEEWSIACSGPYSWPYPYGQRYEPYGCNTHDTAVWPSGSKLECRAYFGALDMSGNLAEWTSTPARENRYYNNVLGGFWESGPRSGCFDVQYSYYPQNRHNPVGFRCCKNASSKQ